MRTRLVRFSRHTHRPSFVPVYVIPGHPIHPKGSTTVRLSHPQPTYVPQGFRYTPPEFVGERPRGNPRRTFALAGLAVAVFAGLALLIAILLYATPDGPAPAPVVTPSTIPYPTQMTTGGAPALP